MRTELKETEMAKKKRTYPAELAQRSSDGIEVTLYWHGGKMMVLKEDALPWVIDPNTLETHGVWDF